MGVNAVTYALSKKYVDETINGFGYLKGAPCKIKSISKENNQSVVTFEWKNDEGETRESNMYVDDGTPIYTWTSGYSYVVGDLAIYDACLYSCTIPNSDVTFNSDKWIGIGSSNGDYSIIEKSNLLPTSFTKEDRKMYYCIEESIFYLWTGTNWVAQEPATISNADIEALFL